MVRTETAGRRREAPGARHREKETQIVPVEALQASLLIFAFLHGWRSALAIAVRKREW